MERQREAERDVDFGFVVAVCVVCCVCHSPYLTLDIEFERCGGVSDQFQQLRFLLQKFFFRQCSGLPEFL